MLARLREEFGVHCISQQAESRLNLNGLDAGNAVQMLVSFPAEAGIWNGLGYMEDGASMDNMSLKQFRKEKRTLVTQMNWEAHYFDRETMPDPNFRELWEQKFRTRLEELNNKAGHEGRKILVNLHGVHGGPECDREQKEVLLPLINSNRYTNLDLALYLWEMQLIHSYPTQQPPNKCNVYDVVPRAWLKKNDRTKKKVQYFFDISCFGCSIHG